jgi:RNA polymerase sigma factor (sigma-70 family)
MTMKFSASGKQALPVEIFLAHRNLVWKTALRLQSRLALNDWAVEDLVQEGSLGIIRAWQTWDAGRGLKFSTYAYPWIYVYMRDWLHKNMSIVRPAWGKWKNSKELVGRIEGDLNGGGLLAALKHQDVSTEETVRCKSGALKVLDAMIEECPTPEEEVGRRELSERVRSVARELSEKLSDVDREILWCRVIRREGGGDGEGGGEVTLETLGRRLGIAKQAVGAREKKLRERLVKRLRRELL